MERYQATVFFGVPTLFEYLKDHKDTDKVNWRRLKLVLSGADTLHETTTKGWARRTGSSITEGYGLSETCAMSHVNPVQRPKAGSFGCPVPDVLAAVIEPESLAFVPPGEIGELVLSGPSVMAGYWRRPEETARAFLERDGRRWLRTGDIVRMDDEGYFHFYDRSKDLIKCKGYSVFAKDVEEVLYAHPHVKAAGVIGVPDPAFGHRIKAIVVLQADARGKRTSDLQRRGHQLAARVGRREPRYRLHLPEHEAVPPPAHRRQRDGPPARAEGACPWRLGAEDRCEGDGRPGVRRNRRPGARAGLGALAGRPEAAGGGARHRHRTGAAAARRASRRPQSRGIGAARALDQTAAQRRPLRTVAFRRARRGDDRAQAERADVHRRPGDRDGPRRGAGRRRAGGDREEPEGGGSVPGVRACRSLR